MPKNLPLIALPSDVVIRNNHPFHGIEDKYVRSAAEVIGCIPVVIPSLGPLINLEEIINRFDGLLVTGSLSNVYPGLYGGEVSAKTEPYDRDRDATSLDLIKIAANKEIPILAICRGLQEMNVAFGGTLDAEIQELPGRMDHREPTTDDLDTKYALRHKVITEAGGILKDITGCEEFEVNSLHRQAIGKIADKLQIEAKAPDGTIEAVSIKQYPSFALGLQWHPEYKIFENPISKAIFAAFGDAVKARA